ncbi:LD-carboxypeptidase, partial [Providencia rettgeri]|nr:LD-carboxypeptidase [Providencia rettgeri]
MLTQLWHAGVLNRQMAVVLGRFTAYKTGASDNGFEMEWVVRWLRETVKVPVVTGLPYGHVEVKVSLPIGQEVGLATEDGMAYLVLDEHEH